MIGAALLALFLGLAAAPAHAAEPASATGAEADGAARVEEKVRDLVVDGLPQRLLLVLPPTPRAILVMLPGGTGDLGLKADGTFRHGMNVLVRTRARFAALGFASVIPDAVDGRNLRGMRATPLYGRIVAALADVALTAVGRPVFLVGTSQGAIAAMNGAAHLPPGVISGLVLTESVSRRGGSRETVFDADPAAVRVPVLILANSDDACPIAPPADAQRIADALTAAKSVEVARLSGGIRAGRDCGSRSPHGYWGIEDEAVSSIAGWIDRQLAAARP